MNTHTDTCKKKCIYIDLDIMRIKDNGSDVALKALELQCSAAQPILWTRSQLQLTTKTKGRSKGSKGSKARLGSG